MRTSITSLRALARARGRRRARRRRALNTSTSTGPGSETALPDPRLRHLGPTGCSITSSGYTASTRIKPGRSSGRSSIVEAEEKLAAEAGDSLAAFTLDTFPADDIPGRAALKIARAWVERGEGGLYIRDRPHRPIGLAYAIARPEEIIHHRLLTRFVNVRALLAELRLEIAEGKSPDVREKVLADILVLDDLGAERPTAWAVETISTIVEDFFRDDGGALIVTTNYSPAELATRLSPPDDLIAGQRIVSRLVQHTFALHLDRADLRARPNPSKQSLDTSDVVEASGDVSPHPR